MDVSVTSEEHWSAVYERRPTEELGWYESDPSTLGLVIAHSTPDDSVIDVGGGDSRLVDALVNRGYGDMTVLDLSEVALERARGRLGGRGRTVEWIHADVTGFAPERTWALWHDRAVFHFLTTREQRDAYRAVASRAIAPGGRLVVATFSSEGPEQCAGLAVCRYDVDSLPAAFAPEFQLVTVGPLAAGRSGEGDQRPYIGAVLTPVSN
ncbi:MAG: class I SAM-dependent methyltransferase [bacterium]|nr:class I SAM-dependent methyltransferase [bacterium]